MSNESANILLKNIQARGVTLQLSWLKIGNEMLESIGTETQYPIASLYKFPLLLRAVAECDESVWEKKVCITPEMQAGGYGVLRGLPHNLEISLGNLAYMALFTSDGTAAEILFNSIHSPLRTLLPLSLGKSTLLTLHHDQMVKASNTRWAEIESESDSVKKQYLMHDFISSAKEIGGFTSAEDFVCIIDQELKNARKSHFFQKLSANHAMKSIRGVKRMFSLVPKHTHWIGKTGTLGHGYVLNDSGIIFRDGAPTDVVCITSYGWRESVEQSEFAIAQLTSAFLSF
jgi:beta-lactamase class A